MTKAFRFVGSAESGITVQYAQGSGQLSIGTSMGGIKGWVPPVLRAAEKGVPALGRQSCGSHACEIMGSSGEKALAPGELSRARGVRDKESLWPRRTAGQCSGLCSKR